MLFDEKKLPYHLMLHKFVSCGGQAAFFDAFYWALSAGGRVPLEQGLEYADLPEGWCCLKLSMSTVSFVLITYTLRRYRGVS